MQETTDGTANAQVAAGRTAASPGGAVGHDGLLALPGLPDHAVLLALLAAWNQRGVHVGFPELTGDRP
ncbi:hypothetical protein [Streptomyces xanthophaeus]|uniref:hypothetical protein n=1 Tax=Streptomyces xanthophaeus TaxID=67385 RepID=UPI00365A11F1